MADVNLRDSAVDGRSIRDTDEIIAFDPNEADASVSARTDTVTEFMGNRRIGQLGDVSDTTPAEGQVYVRRGSEMAPETLAVGHDDAGVDARIAAGVEDYARVGTTATINPSRIAANSIGETKMADNSVGTDQLIDGSVTSDKLSGLEDSDIPPEITRDDEVEDFALEANSTATIPTTRLRDGSVTGPKLASDSVIDGKIADSAAPDIKSALESLSGTSRLDASAVQNIPTGGGGGLTTSQVDARIADWAETNNTDQIPANKLENAHGGPGYVPFNRHIVTVGDGPIAGPVDRGFAEGAYGSIDDATYEGSDGVTYTIRAFSAVAPQAIRLQITPRPPRTGDDSINNASLIIDGVSNPFDEDFALDDTFSSMDATTFTFSGIAHLMPAIGQMIEISIGGATDRLLENLEDDVEAIRQVPDYPTGNNMGRYLDEDGGWTVPPGTGGGGGLNQTQVDARVRAGVKNYAEEGNTTDKIPTVDIADDAITNDKIADDAVNSGQIFDGAVGTNQIADDAVTRAKIGPAAVGSTELGANSVTTGKINNDAVTADKMADNAVSGDVVAADGIGLGKIATGAAPDIVDALETLTGTNRLNASAIRDLPSGGGGGDPEVYITNSPAAEVALTNDSTDGSFGDYEDIATLPAITAAQAGRLRIDAEVEFDATADARTAGGGSRIGADIRIIKGTNTVLEDDPVYGPRNLGNGTTEFQSTNQLKDASIWVYDTAAVGDVYKLQARIATQESRAITVQATTGSKLTAFRGATGGTSGGGESGVGGQTGTSNEVVVFVWRRAATTPAAPTTGVWDNGWTTVPTDWYASPGEVPSAVGQTLYKATGKATLSGSTYNLSDWTVESTAAFNTRYSDSLDGASPYSDARATSVAFNTRLDNGAWSSIWIPLGTVPEWMLLGEATLDTTSTSTSKVITFPVPFNLNNMRDLRFELSLWQSTGQLIDFASSKDISPTMFGVENHNLVSSSPHTNSILSVVLESDDGLRVMAGSGTSLPTGGETAAVKGYFRRHSASSSYGEVGSFRIYEFGRTGMRGYLRLRVR